MSNYPNVIIPTAYHLTAISNVFHNYPPSIVVNGYIEPLPYDLELIASKAVKVAATPKMGVDPYTGKPRLMPSPELSVEMKQYLGPIDNAVTDELIRLVYQLIDFLIVRFSQNNWYNENHECPYRFTGFSSVYSNTYDIVVRCG